MKSILFHLPDFSHPGQTTIISHLDFCNNLLTALPLLSLLQLIIPTARTISARHRLDWDLRSLCTFFTERTLKSLPWTTKVYVIQPLSSSQATPPAILSSHQHVSTSPEHIESIPTSPPKPSFSPFSLLNSSLFFHCLIFMARFPITVASAQMSHPQRCLNSPSYLNE